MAADFADTDGEQGFVRLANGDKVPSDSLAWRDECATRWKHVNTLMSMTGHGMIVARRQYIGDVGRSEGQEAARRLTEALGKAWAERQAAEAAARAQVAP